MARSKKDVLWGVSHQTTTSIPQHLSSTATTTNNSSLVTTTAVNNNNNTNHNNNNNTNNNNNNNNNIGLESINSLLQSELVFLNPVSSQSDAQLQFLLKQSPWLIQTQTHMNVETRKRRCRKIVKVAKALRQDSCINRRVVQLVENLLLAKSSTSTSISYNNSGLNISTISTQNIKSSLLSLLETHCPHAFYIMKTLVTKNITITNNTNSDKPCTDQLQQQDHPQQSNECQTIIISQYRLIFDLFELILPVFNIKYAICDTACSPSDNTTYLPFQLFCQGSSYCQVLLMNSSTYIPSLTDYIGKLSFNCYPVFACAHQVIIYDSLMDHDHSYVTENMLMEAISRQRSTADSMSFLIPASSPLESTTAHSANNNAKFDENKNMLQSIATNIASFHGNKTHLRILR